MRFILGWPLGDIFDGILEFRLVLSKVQYVNIFRVKDTSIRRELFARSNDMKHFIQKVINTLELSGIINY